MTKQKYQFKPITEEATKYGAFFRLPREIIKNPAYRDLSSDAKIAYSLLWDRRNLSLSNGWVQDGLVYVKYSRVELAKDLGCSERTATKVMSELRIYGLVHEKKGGMNKANLIFIGIPSGDFLPDSSGPEPQNLQVHGPEEFAGTDPQNLPGNKNYKNKTYKSKTNNKTDRKVLVTDFGEWWKGYPRKKGRAKSEEYYIALRKKGISREELITARDIYIREVKSSGTDEQFILHGSTFLGPQQRWRDYQEGGTAAVFGGMAEPSDSNSMAEEQRILKEVFGNDLWIYDEWLDAGKPDPEEFRRAHASGRSRPSLDD